MSDTPNTPSSSGPADSSAPAAEGSSTVESQELEGQEGGEESQEAAPQTKAEEKKAVADLKRKLKLKVDGKEFEEEVDLSNEEWLREQLQLAKVSRKRMSEYSSLEKQVDQLFAKLKDPKGLKEVLSHPDIGHDLKKLAAQIIEEEIEDSKKTPEQRRAEEAEAKLKKLMEEREEEKKSQRQKEIEMLEEKAYEQYNASMERALKTSELPNSPYVVRKLADYMYMAVENGIDITPEEVVPLIRDEVMSDIQKLFEVAPVELVEKLVGKAKLNEVRKKRISTAQNPAAAAAVADKKVADVAKPSEAAKPSEKKSYKSFFGV